MYFKFQRNQRHWETIFLLQIIRFLNKCWTEKPLLSLYFWGSNNITLTGLDLDFIFCLLHWKASSPQLFPKLCVTKLCYPDNFNQRAVSYSPLLCFSDLNGNIIGEKEWPEPLASTMCDLACNTMLLMFPDETNELSTSHGHSIKWE